ncbi:MAG: hypothetical protein U1E53_14730 [Dongiaceae bacterium]
MIAENPAHAPRAAWLRRRLLAACIGLLALAGCAGVTDPYISLDQPGTDGSGASADRSTQDAQLELARAKYAGLDAAIGYAEAAKLKYKEALVNQGRLTTWTGAALIPLGTAALGAATLGGSAAAAGILGLTGAGALGTAAWLHNQPAQAAYIAGFTATNCAIEAVLPLRLPADELASLKALSADLRAALGRLDAAIAEVGRLEQTAPARLRAIIGAQSQQAMQVAGQGRDLLLKAAQLRKQIDDAGAQLTTAVDRIAAEVDTAVMNNQASLSALPGIIAGLGQAYAQLSPVPLPTVAPQGATGVQQAGTEIDSALQELKNAAAEVIEVGGRLSEILAMVSAANPGERLRACAVDPQSFAADLAMSPAGPFTITKGAGPGASFVVSGGQSPYFVDVPDAPKGLYVRGRGIASPVYTIEATAEVPPGTYLVVVQDKTGRTRASQVEIRPGTTVPGTGSNATTQPPAALAMTDAVFSGLASDAQREQLQRALCLTGADVDHAWGTRTRDRLVEYQKSRQGAAADGHLTQPQADELLAMTQAQIETRCQLAASLARAERFYQKSVPVLVPVGSGQVVLEAKGAHLDPTRNVVVVTLTPTSIAPPGGGEQLTRAMIAAALRAKVQEKLELTGLADGNFEATLEDPANQLGSILQP